MKTTRWRRLADRTQLPRCAKCGVRAQIKVRYLGASDHRIAHSVFQARCHGEVEYLLVPIPHEDHEMRTGLVFRDQQENVLVRENATGYRYVGPWRVRTEVWRLLSNHMGDTLADAFCEWCDEQPDPASRATELMSIARLMENEREDHLPVHARTGAVRSALFRYAGRDFARTQGYVLAELFE